MKTSRRQFIQTTVQTTALACLGGGLFSSAFAKEGVIRTVPKPTGPLVPVKVASSVDVLILGGSTAAVALAEQAAGRKLTVRVLESRPFLGEDRCSPLDFQNVTPLALKMELEERLLAAAVPFTFGTYLIDLMVDAEGRVGGAVVGGVSGWEIQPCRLLVDATDEATALTRLDPSLKRRGKQKAIFRSMAVNPPSEDAVLAEKISGRKLDLAIWSRAVNADCGDGSVSARAEAEVRARLEGFRRDQLRMADRLAYEPIAAGVRRPGICRVDAADLSALPPAIALASLRQATGDRGAKPGEVVAPTALHPRRAGLPDHSLDTTLLPVLANVDVLVLGGGTGGAPAGIAAARAGARTIVCEYLSNCGGIGTEGLIASYWYGVRTGFTAEIDRGMDVLRGDTPKAYAWNTEHKMHWYLKALADAGASVWFGSMCLGALVEGDRVRGAVVATPWGCGLVRARCCVDSTGSAELPAAAGAPCVVIEGAHVAVQGTGLGPRDPEFQYRNNDHTFVDVSDSDDITQAHVVAKRRFKTSFDCVQIVQSRERRQIVGDVQLDVLDLLGDRTWPDTISMARSTFDSHGYRIHPAVEITPPMKKDILSANVPFRALLPKGLEGVIVTGLGMSAHRDVLPVVRMQGDVQNQGYSAGYAAAMAARANTTPRQMDLGVVQKHLVEIGLLTPEVLKFKDNFPFPDERIAAAIAGPLDKFSETAVVLGDPARALPLLRKAWATAGDDAARRLRLGEFLLACGDTSGAEIVLASCQAWDEGWNFRGLDNWGPSLSRVDLRLILLARGGAPGVAELIRARLTELDAKSAFSHCRAVSVALQIQPASAASPALAALLRLPGMSGHHRHDVRTWNPKADIKDNEERNESLKELHLARALVACGDHEGLGRTILERYSKDLRGHYARHALSLLAEGCARKDAA